LLAAAEPWVLSQIQAMFRAAGVEACADELGLRLEWDLRDAVRTVAAQLSSPLRREVRVAIVPVTNDSAALKRALLASRSLDSFVRELEHEWLDEVLRRDALEFHFQPIVPAKPWRVHGYECLVRGVRAEDKSQIPPARLFEAARGLGCLRELDQRARRGAFLEISRASFSDRDVRYFVNCFADSIYDPRHCFGSTLEAVAAAGLRPEQVVFELVESQTICDRRHLSGIVDFLRAGGFKICFDDVGSACLATSSMAELRPDYVKIDPALLRRAVHSGFDAKVVRDLSASAKRHGIIAIAKGIETDVELRFARNAGIELTQGNYHARPAPAGELARAVA
jgi:EAL domain-containing protein (putative c-di-GMP-specific phosphodiesterase class I)